MPQHPARPPLSLVVIVAFLVVAGVSRIVAAATSPEAAVITTIAGGGPNGLPALIVDLGRPRGVAVDASGAVFIAVNDVRTLAARIFKIHAGVLTVYAGNGLPGFSGDGGPALRAGFDAVGALALDGAGNLLVSDSLRVRRIDASTGIVTTVAGDGTGVIGGEGVQATRAGLQPGGLAVAANGDLFISETVFHRIRRVDASSGTITTVAGNALGGHGFNGDNIPATSALLNNPEQLAFDAGGSLLIADAGNSRIRRVDAGTGIITTVAGGGSSPADGIPATSAVLTGPVGLVVESDGDLVLSEIHSHVVRRVSTATGIIDTIAGQYFSSGFSGDGAAGTSARLSSPGYLALDSSDNLLVADIDNFRVRRLEAATGIISTIAGGGDSVGDGYPATSVPLAPFAGALEPSGDLLVADPFSNRVRRISAATGLISTVTGTGSGISSGDGGPAASASLRPGDVEVDAAGNIYVIDILARSIRRIDAASGVITTVIMDGGLLGGGIVHRIAIDSLGDILVSDPITSTVRRVDLSTGLIVTVAGTGSAGFSGDGGPATDAALDFPAGLALDRGGNLLIVDSGNSRIRRVDAATGIITTVAGNGVAGYSGDDGPATEASLSPSSPSSNVTVDEAGNLFIADSLNGRIRRVDAVSGVITTVAGDGQFDQAVFDGGSAAIASLVFPSDLLLDAAGGLVIVDAPRVRRVSGPGLGTPQLLATDPDLLRAANHRLVPVQVIVGATDRCSPISATLASVGSNEPDDAPGPSDGRATQDIQGAALGTEDFELLLRAERDIKGQGRFYTAVYGVTCATGEIVNAGAVVSVPR